MLSHGSRDQESKVMCQRDRACLCYPEGNRLIIGGGGGIGVGVAVGLLFLLDVLALLSLGMHYPSLCQVSYPCV